MYYTMLTIIVGVVYIFSHTLNCIVGIEIIVCACFLNIDQTLLAKYSIDSANDNILQP